MTMQQLILNKVEESFKKAEIFYGKTLSRPRNIIFKRKGTTAGWSNYYRKELMFQLDFAEHNKEHFLNNTVPHEVAHYVDDEVYGNKYINGRRQVHGFRWKYIMTNVYGLNPDRCHNYDTSVTVTREQFRHEYNCKCQTHKVSTTIHNKIVRGQRRICVNCKEVIVLKNSYSFTPMSKLISKQKEIEELKEKIAKLQQTLV